MLPAAEGSRSSEFTQSPIVLGCHESVVFQKIACARAVPCRAARAARFRVRGDCPSDTLTFQLLRCRISIHRSDFTIFNKSSTATACTCFDRGNVSLPACTTVRDLSFRSCNAERIEGVNVGATVRFTS